MYSTFVDPVVISNPLQFDIIVAICKIYVDTYNMNVVEQVDRGVPDLQYGSGIMLWRLKNRVMVCVYTRHRAITWQLAHSKSRCTWPGTTACRSFTRPSASEIVHSSPFRDSSTWLAVPRLNRTAEEAKRTLKSDIITPLSDRNESERTDFFLIVKNYLKRKLY